MINKQNYSNIDNNNLNAGHSENLDIHILPKLNFIKQKQQAHDLEKNTHVLSACTHCIDVRSKTTNTQMSLFIIIVIITWTVKLAFVLKLEHDVIGVQS